MKNKLITLVIFSGILLISIAGYIWHNQSTHTTQPNGFITVTESSGKDIVLIDNKSIGSTPLISKSVSAGKHILTIKHVINSDSYMPFEKTITISSKTNTVITMTLGPNDTYTGYTILSLTPTENTSGILILNDTNEIDQPLITLNASQIATNMIIHKAPGGYILTITQDGYVAIHNEIQLPKGYIMTEIVHLFKKPIG